MTKIGGGGTISQHDASTPLTGGPYSLTGGFWAIISSVQTAGLRNCTNIFGSGTNSITLISPDKNLFFAPTPIAETGCALIGACNFEESVKAKF